MDMKGNEIVSSASRESLYNQGYQVGYEQAAEDFSIGKLDFQIFEEKKTIVELLDFYGLGFEMGYLKKCAELGLC